MNTVSESHVEPSHVSAVSVHTSVQVVFSLCSQLSGLHAEHIIHSQMNESAAAEELQNTSIIFNEL